MAEQKLIPKEFINESSTVFRNTKEIKAVLDKIKREVANANFVTPVNNSKPPKKDTSGTHFPLTVQGPTEIKANTEAVYTITEYQKNKKASTPEDADKKYFKWAFYIDGVKIEKGHINYLRLFTVKRKGAAKEEKHEDFMAITDAKARTAEIDGKAILFKKNEIKDGVVTLTVKFSKWLDGHNIHIEAFRNSPDLNPKKGYVVTTAVKATPEIIEGHWVNHQRETITGKTVGYKDTVYMYLKTLGMKNKKISTALWEEGVTYMGSYQGNDNELCMNENIQWQLDARDSYKKLELPDQDNEDYKKQREGIWESDPLELYFALPSEKQTTGYQNKFGQLLYLTTKERITDAYFAKQDKQEAIKDGTVNPKPKPKPKPNTHIVKDNETLSRIAPKYGIKWKKLADHNNIKAPYYLTIGQTLKLPDNAVMPKSETTKAKKTDPKSEAKTTENSYKKIDKDNLGNEVHLVIETANLKGKTVNIELFDNEGLMAKDADTPLKLLMGDTELTKLENIPIDAKTSKATVKVKLRPKSDDDFKKLKDKFKVKNTYKNKNTGNEELLYPDDHNLKTCPDDYTLVKTGEEKIAKLNIKVTCKGEEKANHKAIFEECLEVEVGKDWRPPIDNPQITIYTAGGNKRPWRSAFGDVRRDIRSAGLNHKGLDLFANIGTNVFACLPGIVTTIGYQSGGAGHYIKIKVLDDYVAKFHQLRRNYSPYYVKSIRSYDKSKYDIDNFPDFIEQVGVTNSTEVHFVYMHLKSGSINVKKNETISESDYKTKVIAQTGDSGASETKGPHLHFEIRGTTSGSRFNPAYYVNYKNETELTNAERKVQDTAAGK